MANCSSSVSWSAKPPSRPKVPSPTWRSFLRNHMTDTVAVDVFVVATATTVIVLGHDRRRVIHFEVTQNPTQAWLARQMTEAFPWASQANRRGGGDAQQVAHSNNSGPDFRKRD
jgi:putative transposase